MKEYLVLSYEFTFQYGATSTLIVDEASSCLL